MAPIPDERGAAALGARLRALGVTRAFVQRHAERDGGLGAVLTLRREARYSSDPAVLALRLLFCGETLTPEEKAAAIGDLKQPVLHLRMAGGLYIMSDFLLREGSPPDAVMGAGETTAVLWRAARPSHRVEVALDLGCGAGTLALLLAASHAERVVGTDVNPRAIKMARCNAALNGIANVEFRAGDLYGSAEGERFNLIVSQPPYYPGSGAAFLHGGQRGDEIARRVIDGVAGRLTPAGRALVLSSWPDDSWPMAAMAGHDLIALTVDRRELPGAEPGLVAIQPGQGRSERHQAAPECWGEITATDLDCLFAGEAPPATRSFEEDGVVWEVRPVFGIRRQQAQASGGSASPLRPVRVR